MNETSTDQNYTDFLTRITLICIAITAGISGITIVGWILQWLIIIRINTDYIPMAPSTAIAFFILSIALLIYTRYNAHPLVKTLGKAGAVLIFLVCFIILFSFITGNEFDIEQVIYPDPKHFGEVHIGRMSPLTAIDFLLASCALLLLFTSREGKYRAKSYAAFLVTIVFLSGLLIVIGYWYGTPLLYGGAIVPTALTTAIAFVFLSIGTITATGREYWPIRAFIGNSVNARLMRTFLPITVALILIQGWFCIVVYPISGNYVLSTTLVALLSAFIIGFAIMKIAQMIGSDIDHANNARTQAEESLRINEHRLIRAQEIAHIGDWEFDIEADKFTWSDELYHIYGIDPATKLNLEFLSKKVHPNDIVHFGKYLTNLVKKGKGEALEYRIIRPDRSTRSLNLTGKVVRDSSSNIGSTEGISKVVKIYGTIMDITRRKQMENEIKQMNVDLEKRVAERTSELTLVIKEIEAFSYSISHDLRTPLRSVSGFSQILLEDYGNKIDKTGLGYLQRVSNAALNMGRLIDDLLNLSRISRDKINYSEVDLSGLASKIANKHKMEEPGRDIEFIIDEGLKVTGDKRLLKTMFENLISNACKFSSHEPVAKIEFGRTNINNKNVYYLRDNGVGFDMKYADKLFGAHQRLHSESQFPGMGIGLAIVQRIIHKHSGHIWAESELGKGATFYFTL